MKRTLKSAVALGLAAALSFSPVTSAPAYAGDRDQAIVAGTLGLLLLGTLAHAASNSNGRFTVTTQTPRYTQPSHQPVSEPRHPRVHNTPRAPQTPTVVIPSRNPKPPRHGGHRKPTLPSSCAINARSGTYMSQSCLERSGVSTRRMPQSCEVRLVTRQGHRARTGYSTRCLSRAGYEVQGGRHSRR